MSAAPGSVDMVRASAPGKCILFGEHAVVYGHPAVAVAIDSRVTVTAEESTDDNWRLDGALFAANRHPHIAFLKDRFWSEEARPLALSIKSELFSAAGLGSSAALSAAVAACLQKANRVDVGGQSGVSEEGGSRVSQGQASGVSGVGESGLSEQGSFSDSELEQIATAAHLAEAGAQGGRASPTDTSTSTLGGCVLISDRREDDALWHYTRALDTPEGRRSWEVHSIELSPLVREAWLVVGFTGVRGPTAEMVAKVASLLQSDPAREQDVARIGAATRIGVMGLQAANLDTVGAAMDECHGLLSTLGVSSPDLDRLVAAARPTAIGAKLTGAGGGGCMLALTHDPKRTAGAIELMGGRTLISPLGAAGVRIE